LGITPRARLFFWGHFGATQTALNLATLGLTGTSARDGEVRVNG
jgi:hypothetical protein